MFTHTVAFGKTTHLARRLAMQWTQTLPEHPTTCATDSPSNCTVEPVSLVGHYSPGRLLIVRKGLRVKMSTERNSCPLGWKIFSPRSKQDWITVKKSVKEWPMNPSLLVDITRPVSGCQDCERFPMNSGVLEQSLWVTQDRSPWWLRDTRHNEPNGDYTKNCYMHIKAVRDNGNIFFNDSKSFTGGGDQAYIILYC